MAKKLYEQEEAARILGITLDRLNELRDRGKLYPKRDVGIWKYDSEDLERYQRELAEGSGLGFSWESGGIDEISLADENAGEADSILLSEAELGQSPETTKSTIIGKQRNADAASSDIRLASDSDLKLKSDEGTKSGIGKAGSDIDLLSASSDLNLSDSKTNLGASGSGLFDDEEFSLEPLGSDKSGVSPSGSFKLMDDEIQLEGTSNDPDNDTRKGAKSSGSSLSGLQLGDDDELVLDGHESDITLGAADSGIMLIDPADSGLSLEQPLSLGGSSLSGSNMNDELTIGEDDMITLEEQVDLEGATQLRSDEDFALTPTGLSDDDSDSGSQVIALDSEDDLSAGSLFGNQSSDSLLQAETYGSPLGDASMGVGLAGAPMMMPAASLPEAPFSLWNVLALITCTIFLLLSGIMAYDLAMQIWSYDKPHMFTSSLMDSLIGLFEK